MQGMTLPRPGSPRDEWTDGESLAVELLNLASWLTQRTIYDANRNLRKGVALDETHFLSQVPTGKVLIDRLARDSRKFNVRALFASQLAGDLLRVSGFASLVNAVFVGRTDDEEAQAEALRLLRVPTGVGYEQMLGTLSPRPRHDDRPDDTPRQFVFADGHGGVEKIRIDLEAPHLDHVREALDTNPDASRVVRARDPGRRERGGAAGAGRAGPGRCRRLDDRTEARRRRSARATARPAGRRGDHGRHGAVRRRGGRPLRRPRRDPGGGPRRGRGERRAATGPAGSGRVPRAGTGSAAGPCGDAPGTAGGCAGCLPCAGAGRGGAHRGPAAGRARPPGPPRGRGRVAARGAGSRCSSSPASSARRRCSARRRSPRA